MDEQRTFDAGRPVVLRGGTVLTMDSGRQVLVGGDVGVYSVTIVRPQAPRSG